MMYRKSLLLLFCFFLSHSDVIAQTVVIEGNTFYIRLNEQDMTASIYDPKYVIDDREFPLSRKERKFKALKGKVGQFNTDNPVIDPVTVVIPSTYTSPNGNVYDITTIGKAAFAGYQNVDRFIIPASVTAIDDYAFYRTSIMSVEIPASVQKIGKRVFGHCYKLKEIKSPKGLAYGNDSYRESKEVAVNYYSGEFKPFPRQGKRLAGNNSIAETVAVAAMPTKTNVETKAVSVVSDVDIDLPTSSRENENLFALILANENYMNVANVECALNDGRTFKTYCEKVLGMPKDNVHLVEDATYGQMVEQINWISQIGKVYKGDAKIIVYYAGHGIPNEKDRSAYLLPVDVSGDNTAAAYSLSTLYKQLGSLNVKNVIVFMDACFSGSRRGDGMLMSARGVAIKTKAETPVGNMIVFTAAQNDETAYPYKEKGHGLFTYYLLKKLKETKGDVDFGTLSNYIKKEVSRRSVVVNNKPQTPSVSFSYSITNDWEKMKLK